LSSFGRGSTIRNATINLTIRREKLCHDRQLQGKLMNARFRLPQDCSLPAIIVAVVLFAIPKESVLAQNSLVAVATTSRFVPQQQYDPLAVDSNAKVETLLFEIEYKSQSRQLRQADSLAESRKVPVKVYLPSKLPAPVVLFSHGLGGSREGFKHGGEHWARRGYVAVFLQHPGSDESVWKSKGIGQRMNSMREAASAQNLMLRIDDVKAVIDYLEKVQRDDSDVTGVAKRLAKQLDLKHLGMSGHSFGAITTQMVSGQSPVVASQKPTDSRITAAVVLSPSPPKIGQPDKYFSNVSIPWLLMTGTKADSPIGDQSAESRLKVFPALPAGSKYQVVFDGGTHSFLGERNGITNNAGEQTTHAKATVALSTAFWDTYLMNDPAARQWLDGDGPKKILAEKDVWQKK
jgi:dienelactone hydrolase